MHMKKLILLFSVFLVSTSFAQKKVRSESPATDLLNWMKEVAPPDSVNGAYCPPDNSGVLTGYQYFHGKIQGTNEDCTLKVHNAYLGNDPGAHFIVFLFYGRRDFTCGETYYFDREPPFTRIDFVDEENLSDITRTEGREGNVIYLGHHSVEADYKFKVQLKSSSPEVRSSRTETEIKFSEHGELIEATGHNVDFKEKMTCVFQAPSV